MVIELSHTSRRVVEIAVKGSVFFPSAPTLLQLSFVSLSRYLLLFSHPSPFVYVCLYVFVCVRVCLRILCSQAQWDRLQTDNHFLSVLRDRAL